MTRNSFSFSKKDNQVGEKRPNFFTGLIDTAMDAENDVTFDSAEFCATRIYGRLNTDKSVKAHFSPLKFGVATAGVLSCVVAVDAVLLPWNIAKQSARSDLFFLFYSYFRLWIVSS